MNITQKILVLAIVLTSLLTAASADIGVPPSEITGLDTVSGSSHVILSIPDVNLWLRDDSDNSALGIPMRIGAERLLDENIESLATVDFDSEYGQIWRLAVTSPDALQMKIQLTDVRLDASDELFVYGPGQIESDSYTMMDKSDSETIWSWGTPGDTLILEWHHQDSSVTESDSLRVPFNVKSISHIYRDYTDTIMTREGNCHNDVMCDTGWSQQRDATAHIEFNDGGTYICTGTMLNCVAQDFTPYFLTANHCITNNTVANTVKAWFFFNATSCNAGPPTRGYRTVAGGTFLATGAAQGGDGPDFTLIRLNNSDYSGVYFAGWDRTVLGNGTAVTSIHHPDGAYKRISYGTVRSTWYDGQYGVNWDRTGNPGVTEGGSSGGALFTSPAGRVVGQLWAGASSCSYQNGRDFYGRFSVSFNQANLGQWLGNATMINGAYYSSSGQTPTPTPTRTPKPTATAGPGTPTNTPNPSWTPTPQPGVAVELKMKDSSLVPGDPFETTVELSNNTSSPYTNIVLFVVLDIHGQLFFAPDFNDFSYYAMYLPPGKQVKSIIPEFAWPSGAGTLSDVYWYAGFTDPGMTQLIGDYDVLTFSWSE